MEGSDHIETSGKLRTKVGGWDGMKRKPDVMKGTRWEEG